MVPQGSSDQDETNDDLSHQEAADPLGLGGFLHADLDEGVSLDDLGRAYAELMGGGDDPYQPRGPETELAEIQELVDRQSHEETGEDHEVSPRGILEAMLFVGDENQRGLSARMIASFMRGVSPDEIAEMVAELNELYAAEEAPYEIILGADGYRMGLRSMYQPLRDRFFGKIRDAKLTQAAIDVLAIVAYRQPLDRDLVDELRGQPSGALLNQLVRRQLLKLEIDPGPPKRKLFRTTDRFLALFELESLEDLPQSQDLDRWTG